MDENQDNEEIKNLELTVCEMVGWLSWYPLQKIYGKNYFSLLWKSKGKNDLL